MSVEDSLKKLRKVSSGKSQLEFMSTTAKTPLAHACSIIGMYAGFELNPRSMQEENLKELCKIGHLHYRKIELPPNWWEKDHGPLLGYYQDQPVALLLEGDEYILVFPKEEKKISVTESISSEIQPEAYMLYPPLPEEVGTFRALFRAFFHRKMRDYLSLFGAGILAAVVALFVPISNKILFDQAIPHFNYSLLGQVLLGLVVAAVSSSIFLLARSFVGLRLNAKISHFFQMSLWDRILKLPVRFFRSMARGDLIQRTMIFSVIRRLLSQNTIIAFFDSLFASLYFFIMLYYNWKLALLSIVLLLFVSFFSVLLALSKIKWDKALLESNADINAFLISMVKGMEKLRIAASETFFFSSWAKKYAENQTLSLKGRFISAIVETLNKTASIFFVLVIYGVVIFDRLSDPVAMTLGDYLAFIAAFAPLVQASLGFLNIGVSLITLFPYWKRVQPLLTSELETKKEQQSPGAIHGKIILKNVQFRYQPNAPPVLKDFNLEIQPGEFLAIVGPTGCGKSTLCRLLVGFEIAQGGTIQYDDRDLDTLILPELREQVSFIMQQKTIFSGTIYENIVCGNPYSLEEVKEAMAFSTIDRDMHRFPSGLNTLLPSGGGVLSAGERQKLIIARAIIRKPKILIFDEGLNSLASSVQQEIFNNLKSLPITRILATHQLSLVRQIDRICCMQQGNILMDGSFDELLEKDVCFREVIEKQSF